MEENKGILRVYMEKDEDGVDLFVVERINPFNYSFKKIILLKMACVKVFSRI